MTYSWTIPAGQGTLNNYNIANPVYTPPNVSSPQTFTLTAKVSDGADITTQTVNITVTDTIVVNQAPVITSVTASPSAIADNETSQLQVIAYDPDSGPNALTYSWTVPAGQGSLNNYNITNPIYTPPDVSSPQTFTLTVAVSDGADITTQTVDIIVTDSNPGSQILLSENFNDGNYNGWILVDQGTDNGPMVWSAASGVMIQSSNTFTYPNGPEVPKLGTYAYWQAGSGWTDYTTEVTIKSTDDDAIGIMFRYQDENNYYRFSWDKSRNYRRLVKCENGVFTVLAEDSDPYVIGKSYQLKIAAHGSTLQVSIDGNPVFLATDSTFSSGTIALYCWGNTGSYFDNITVEGLSGTNQAPVITSVTASPSAISDTETSQLQVNAYDPDSGPSALTYSWTIPAGQGTLNNYNIANPIYTPPNVSSVQTFTLTAKVSDGADITTQTVNIIVTDSIVVNQAPVITSVTASPSAISDTETSQLQVNAYDPDSGPSALTYSWTIPAGQGTLNNYNIANPVYTPPNVSSPQTFTLTAKVSDGADITTQTVNITVTDTIVVNQAPVITSVTASPSAIADNETSQLQVIAYDPDSGPNALTYSWTVPAGQGSLNNYNITNPIYTPPDVSSPQTFTLTVAVSDGADITTQTVDIIVTDSNPGSQILLSENFNDGNYNGWILVDQGTDNGPMVWSAASGVMIQSSNTFTYPNGPEVPKLGTYAYWQAGSGWTDYTTEVTIKSTDDDAIGIMFRYQDENNYYRFSWDKSRNYRRLVKCENGVFTVLAEDSDPYVIGKSYQLKIAAHGNTLQVSIDGSPVFSVIDNTFSSGTIALYCWGNTGSYFDDITVTT